ncbi:MULTISPECIES: resuscitation-promoting factor [Actinoalloteichus]|uniref:Uncharacterized conserved protein YabE, contains G5 and tandem DUF348 domains n=2 Tax=Actinoalloteichus cyanogriseus TaxID=2893586 RepID=A0ABT1JIY2_ACTCY|nr:resuscitation-promoting factor [Actinoalloteichus caeruleus]MCP2332433.1 Uncharacterized conserved protein YabE, contains G5 and tandem DUF348 domains [Actinoalloteichus caeruleus DSM 43889]
MNKRTFLRAVIVAVLTVLIGGSGTAIAMDKSITLTVDDEQRIVRTFASTVAGVLATAGFEAGEQDALAPAAQATVVDGSQVVLKRGRLLTLRVDGEEREVWTHALTLDDALNELGMPTNDAELSVDRHQRIPLDGMTVDLKTSKLVTLLDGAEDPRQVATTSATVGELLADQGVALEGDDEVTPPADTKLVNDLTIEVTRIRSEERTEEVEITPDEERIDDPEMEKGEEEVEEEGRPGLRELTYLVTLVNGEETEREQIRDEVIREAENRVVRVGTKQPPAADAPPVQDGGVWDRLAHCESTGNWQIVSANGLYYGGLQFSKPTWDAYGGQQYANYPNEASREQQIAVATRLRDANGGSYGSWPGCAAKLGLPT